MSNELQETTKVIRIIRAFVWILAAQVVISLVAFLIVIPLMFFLNLKMAPIWLSTASRYERMLGGLLVAVGFQCVVNLILLFATKRVSSLNRSMVWVLTGWAAWHLLNVPLPMLGKVPISYDSFFFLNTSELNSWCLSVGLLGNSAGEIAGIVLYLLWKHLRRKDGKSGRISNGDSMEVR